MTDIASSPTPTPEAQPSAPAATIDPARQAQAKRYAGLRRVLSLVDLAVGAVALVVVLVLGLHLRLRDALTSAGLGGQPWPFVLIAAYAAVYILGYTVLTFPLAIYGGFVLPHRFGLSRQGFGGWLGDQGKGLLLSLLFGLAVVEGMYLLLAKQPLTWWLWVAGIALIFTVVLANLAPVLLLPLFYKLTPMPEGELRDRLLRMAERAHTQVRGVYVMNMSRKTSEGNAALMG